MFVHRRAHTHLVAAMALCLACDSPTGTDSALLESSLASARDRNAGTVATPFAATAVTQSPGIVPDPACGAPPRFLETQIGEGTGTYLGRFTITFTFCVDATDLLDDGMLTPGESVPYDNVLGIITAANGDQLFLTGSGEVLPSNEPGFVFEFHDTFTFAGGTGRFAGASGQLTTDSYVSQPGARTEHTWQGTLVRPRGR